MRSKDLNFKGHTQNISYNGLTWCDACPLWELGDKSNTSQWKVWNLQAKYEKKRIAKHQSTKELLRRQCPVLIKYWSVSFCGGTKTWVLGVPGVCATVTRVWLCPYLIQKTIVAKSNLYTYITWIWISYDTWWESSWIKSHRKNRTDLLIINLKIKISTKDAFKGGRSRVKAKEA